MSFFGELYLRSTLPFLSDDVTTREVEYLARAFQDLEPLGPLADLGCGHGRHAARLNKALSRPVVGLELDPGSLALRELGWPVVRADLRALPFATGSLAGAYAWYSTLFVFQDDAVHSAIVRDVFRSLKPGGRFLFHSVPYERLAQAPQASFEQRLPDGSQLVESSAFNPATGIDSGTRKLVLPDGRVLSGTYGIRYHPLPELLSVFQSVGFHVRFVHGGLDGSPLERQSHELVLGVDVPHA